MKFHTNNNKIKFYNQINSGKLSLKLAKKEQLKLSTFQIYV